MNFVSMQNISGLGWHASLPGKYTVKTLQMWNVFVTIREVKARVRIFISVNSRYLLIKIDSNSYSMTSFLVKWVNPAEKKMPTTLYSWKRTFWTDSDFFWLSWKVFILRIKYLKLFLDWNLNFATLWLLRVWQAT